MRTYIPCPKYLHRKDIDVCEAKCEEIDTCMAYYNAMKEIEHAELLRHTGTDPRT